MKPDEPTEEPDSAHSSFHLSVTLSIGYQRRRAKLAGHFESGVTSIGLLIGGIAVVLLFLYWLLSRLALL